jgi:type VI secretion system protein ImpI
MYIRLQINNVDTLPAGISTGYAARDRSFEIGRDACDWTLSDPDKFISGRHCEVRYEAGAFWLHDISRNGTFVNGSDQRMTGPHRLGHGDRMLIGRYVIFVSIDEERATTGHPQTSHGSRQREMPAATGRPPEFGDGPFFDPAEQRSGQRVPAPTFSSQPAPLPSTRDEVLREIAIGAGISPELLQLRDPHEVAAEIGAVLRAVVEELAVLLKARAAAKMLAKSTQRTMISAADNNPLKFVPGTDDILEIMFARRRAGYLDARRTNLPPMPPCRPRSRGCLMTCRPRRSARNFPRRRLRRRRARLGTPLSRHGGPWRKRTKTACWIYSSPISARPMPKPTNRNRPVRGTGWAEENLFGALHPVPIDNFCDYDHIRQFAKRSRLIDLGVCGKCHGTAG